MHHYNTYIGELNRQLRTGYAGEHAYRGGLQNYLNATLPAITVINDPNNFCLSKDTDIKRKVKPDYIIQRTAIDLPIGFIETKDIDVKLNSIEESSQLKDYRNSLDNLILTNFREFRFFEQGEKVQSILIADLHKEKVIPLSDQVQKLEDSLQTFTAYEIPVIKTASKLAQMMAAKARLMRDAFQEILRNDWDEAAQELKKHLFSFRRILIQDLSEDRFADAYAQSITYGLFTACLHDDNLKMFTRKRAQEIIPSSNPFLQELFSYIAKNLNDKVAWVADALCATFRATDLPAILRDFGNARGETSDPIIHFYETFLKAYDPKLKQEMGVYYTPEPVVGFIVRAIDTILKTRFHLLDGLADTSMVQIPITTESTASTKGKKKSPQLIPTKEVHRVQLLDVATGTGTFLAETIRQIHQQFAGQEGMWSDYVERHLIPRLYGFEILMASYAMCHLKLELQLEKTGYKSIRKNHRLQVYLTNALEDAPKGSADLPPFGTKLAEEGIEAARIKRETPVMVAFGNPPYKGHSMNSNIAWMDSLLKAYKQEPDGGRLQERNLKWLNDDYVKFIRLGEHYIQKNGEGILAYITNHGYLDNPTFRGMRWHLLNTFEEIHIIDLHGNGKKQRLGAVDENVFPTIHGVGIAIILAIRTRNKKPGIGKLFHAEIKQKTLREKHSILQNALFEKSCTEISFAEIQPEKPDCFFVPRKVDTLKKYTEGFSLQKLFIINSAGIVTARDSLTIHQKKDDLQRVTQDFSRLSCEDARNKYLLGKEDVRDWQVSWAQKDLKTTNLSQANIASITYRPFDKRWTYYTGKTKGFHCMPRNDVMQHLRNTENIGVFVGRQGKVIGDMPWNLGYIFKNIVDFNVFYRGGGIACPLYIYSDTQHIKLVEGIPSREPNLNREIINCLADRLGLSFISDHDHKTIGNTTTFSPLDVLDYLYAILYSPAYREKYKEFLRSDFPRIPWPTSADIFWKLTRLGDTLRQLHLLEHPIFQNSTVQYGVSGSNEVKRFEFIIGRSGLGQVHINATQYFKNVPEAAWNFWIGGYQPAQKWLKDRKGKILNCDDIRHYQKMIMALIETEKCMKEIDSVWKP